MIARLRSRALDALSALSWRMAGGVTRRTFEVQPASAPWAALAIPAFTAIGVAVLAALWWLPILIWEMT